MGVIRLATEIPGPGSRALIERRQRAVPRGVPLAAPIVLASGTNAMVTDVDGNQLIDFAGGIGTLNTGHRHPAVVAAAKDQLDRLIHTCFQVAAYEPYVAAAERLNALAPGEFPKKTMFVRYIVCRTRTAIVARAHGRTRAAAAPSARASKHSLPPTWTRIRSRRCWSSCSLAKGDLSRRPRSSWRCSRGSVATTGSC